jgi:membrane protease YdiL (CAAX protease family)
MIRTAFQTMHPFGQFIFFSCSIITGMAMALGLGLFIITLGTGDSISQGIALMNAPQSPGGREYNLIINSINQLVSFGLTAVLARYLFMGQTLVTARLPKTLGWILWAVVFAYFAQPLIDITSQLNAICMNFLPDSLVDQADSLEKMAQNITIALLSFDTAWHFPATLLTVAVFPAICEELTFRGVLQPLFARWTQSIHLGIWISALLFSAIHLQFHGFIPRMVLGAGLGYLVYYSGSLWPAIVAHFMNNAMAVCLAAWFGPDWVQEEMVNIKPWEWSDYFTATISLPVLFYGFKWMHNRSTSLMDHPTTSN